MFTSRRQVVFFILSVFLITNAVVAELIGGKLLQMPEFSLGFITIPAIVLSVGVLPWPIVFLTTDLVNEYYGKKAVRWLTMITVILIAYAFFMLFAAIEVPTWEHSPVTNEMFTGVFGQSKWIIVGSITAFAVSQMVDVVVFWFLRNRTKGKLLWLRATGSTVISQLIDTFIVLYIGFVLPGMWTMEQYLYAAMCGYFYKVLIAILITPLIYLLHNVIDKYLGPEAHSAAKESETQVSSAKG